MIFNPFSRRLKTLNRIEIHQSAIFHNLEVFRSLLPEHHIFPVLKSNAYGHGIGTLSEILKHQDFPYIVVDSYYEALQVQKVSSHKCLIIGWNHPENLRHFNFRKVSLVVWDTKTLKTLCDLKKSVRIHLQINTGMNRQGISPDQLSSFLDILAHNPHIHLEGIFSHFADADNTQNSYTHQQEQIFSNCLDLVERRQFAPTFIHLSNTPGALKTTDPRINSIRLGIGLYGHNPLSESDPLFSKFASLTPALRLISTIVNIHHLKKGEKVSYNGTFTAPKSMRIGVVPVGYYEFLPRTPLSNAGHFKAQNQYLPIVGRVCMNLTCFDMADTNLSIGDEVEIIGTDSSAPNSIESIARISDTIPYEILAKISESIRRVQVKR